MSEPNKQPTEQEIREYLSQLRTVAAAQVVSEVVFSLVNAAQAKLGRRDARLMIDLSGLMLGHAGRYLPADQKSQLEQLLGQLRIAQVRAENEIAAKGQSEPNDLAEIPTPPSTTPPAPSQRPASKLWVPGQKI